MELGCWEIAEERLPMQMPRRLYVGEGPLFLDAVIRNGSSTSCSILGLSAGSEATSAMRWRRSLVPFPRSPVRVDSRIGFPRL